MPNYYLNIPSDLFDRRRWRSDAQYRNRLIIHTCLDALRLGVKYVEICISGLRAYAGYAELCEKDKQLFQQYGTYIRRIVTNWDMLDEEAQLRLISGETPPSRVNAWLRDHCKCSTR